MNREQSPVTGSQRIDYLDVVRGIAIFGILLTNIEWFSFYSPDHQGPFLFGSADGIVRILQYMFIEGKFYTIFSILFGWGIAIQIKRFADNDKGAAKFIRRRLYFMMLLGGIHLFFIWEGDIVFFYALVGFVLLAMRNLSSRTLLVTGILLLLSPVLVYYLRMKIPLFNSPVAMLTGLGERLYQINGWTSQDVDRTRVLMESKSIFASIRITLSDIPYRFANLLFASRAPKVLGAMLVGFVVGRTQIYPKILEQKRKLFRLSWMLLLMALPLNYLLARYLYHSESSFTWTTEGFYKSIVFALGVFPLAVSYMLVLALLLDNKKIRRYLLTVIPVGKTAFSNYMLQSLIGIVLFYGAGFSLAQQFGPLSLTIIVVIIFLFQILISTIWLKYFRFGPVEYIWRSLTYGKIQPMRKQPHRQAPSEGPAPSLLTPEYRQSEKA